MAARRAGVNGRTVVLQAPDRPQILRGESAESIVGIEIEFKFRLTDPGPFRARLRAAGAEFRGRFLESDHIFDTADRRLLTADCGLRLRTRRSIADPAEAPVHTLTYKGPRRAASPESTDPNPGRKSGADRPTTCVVGSDVCPPNPGRESEADRPGALPPVADLPGLAGGSKVREELETSVVDAAALEAILRSLGYHEVVAYEKRREVWRWGGCVVTLDELPQLGWWLEIEGPDGTAVEQARAALDLAAAVPAGETYVELAAVHGEAGPAGIRALRFT